MLEDVRSMEGLGRWWAEKKPGFNVVWKMRSEAAPLGTERMPPEANAHYNKPRNEPPKPNAALRATTPVEPGLSEDMSPRKSSGDAKRVDAAANDQPSTNRTEA